MNLRVIPTGVHGALDYLATEVDLLAPSLFGLDDVPQAALAPRHVGAAGTTYSLITDYELGAVKLTLVRIHLIMDAVKGAFLASSPWLFGFANKDTRYWLPHVILGTLDVLVALMRQPLPSRRT
jgi:hypothetical protein